MAVEGSVRYGMALRLEDALSGYALDDATALLEPIRMIKTAEELPLIRRAIGITEASIAATQGQLAAGMTERDVARLKAEIEDAVKFAEDSPPADEYFPYVVKE